MTIHIFQAMWTHCVFAVSEEERKTLREIQAPFLSLTASPGQIKSWLEGGNNAYGWGISAVVQDPRFEEQWLDGLCISQYYYACIDIADTSLPRLISEQRMASLRGEDRVVMAQSKDLRQALIVLQVTMLTNGLAVAQRASAPSMGTTKHGV